MKKALWVHLLASLALAWTATAAWGQSSSIYVQETKAPQTPAQDTRSATTESNDRVSPAIRKTSLMAVGKPAPRKFELHDLVNIIVRESTSADISSKLETDKESGIEAEITDFPRLNVADLLELQLRPSNMSGGEPKVGIKAKKDFAGEGKYERNDSFTARIQASVIEIKPNGLLVLEARKYIRTEKETLTMTLTGTCRPQDVTGDNSVLSTELSDLHLVKEHEGEIEKTTKKGLLTKFFETLFAF